MNSSQLFSLKEEMLTALRETIENENFQTQEKKDEIFCERMTTIMDFYQHAIKIVVNEEESPKKAA